MFPGNQILSVYNAYSKSGYIIVPFAVESGHFRSFPAKEGTPGFLAGISHPSDDFSHMFRIQLSCGNVIQEEQRTRALYQYVINAHSYTVLSDGVMDIHFNSQSELGPYAIRSGYKDGIIGELILQGIQTAKSAKVPYYARGICRLNAILNQFNFFFTGINIYASFCICQTFFLILPHVVLLIHSPVHRFPYPVPIRERLPDTCH